MAIPILRQCFVESQQIPNHSCQSSEKQKVRYEEDTGRAYPFECREGPHQVDQFLSLRYQDLSYNCNNNQGGGVGHISMGNDQKAKWSQTDEYNIFNTLCLLSLVK